MARALNLVHALLEEDMGAGQARRLLEVDLRDLEQPDLSDIAALLDDDEPPDPETWGTGPEAQAGLEAAMRAAGQARG